MSIHLDTSSFILERSVFWTRLSPCIVFYPVLKRLVEEKVSGLEGCHGAFEVRLQCVWGAIAMRLGSLRGWGVGHGEMPFRWPYRKEGLRFRRLPLCV